MPSAGLSPHQGSKSQWHTLRCIKACNVNERPYYCHLSEPWIGIPSLTAAGGLMSDIFP